MGRVAEKAAVLLRGKHKAIFTSHVDTGFDVFHMPTSVGIACMNCHPEGGDDSHTWIFTLADGQRERRTQSLRGGIITDSAPYHWDGDMADLQALCDEVFTHRMGGGSMLWTQTNILSRFINAIPRGDIHAIGAFGFIHQARCEG